MSWLTTIEQIGKDVSEGLAIAGQVLEETAPTVPLGAVLLEVSGVINAIEAGVTATGKTPAPSTVSNLVQAAASTAALKATIAK